MRVAAIYDIHGNLPALEAVLRDIHQAKVDHVVVGGDVLPGPMARETLACLVDLPIPVQFIQGNGDRAVLEQRAGKDSSALPEQARDAVRWTAQQLQPEQERLLASWPKTLRVEIFGLGEVLFCHATPRNDTEIFTRLTPESRLLPVFEGLDVALVVCGHTHMQFDRWIGGLRVVNAGSVECPLGNQVPIGSCLDPRFSFGTRSTISRKLLSLSEVRVIRKLNILRYITSCNPHPREKCSKYSPVRN